MKRIPSVYSYFQWMLNTIFLGNSSGKMSRFLKIKIQLNYIRFSVHICIRRYGLCSNLIHFKNGHTCYKCISGTGVVCVVVKRVASQTDCLGSDSSSYAKCDFRENWLTLLCLWRGYKEGVYSNRIDLIRLFEGFMS